MVYRVRKQLVEEGFEAALSRKQRVRTAVPRIFDGEKEAKLIALACVVTSQVATSWILCVAMSKHFRPWKIDETHLLPPSVQDYVAEDHLSRLVVSVVRESLDLSEIAGSYSSGLGQPPFDPQMMTALLLDSTRAASNRRGGSPGRRWRGRTS